MRLGPSGPKETTEGIIATNGKLAMIDVSGAGVGDGLYRKVTVAAPSLSFSLVARTRESPLELFSTRRSYSERLTAMRLEYKVMLAPFGFYEGTLKRFLSNPEVKQLSITEGNRDGKRCVVLEYRDEFDESRGIGKIWLLKDASWALSEYEMKSWAVRNEGKSWGFFRGKVEYSKIVNAIPYLSSAKFWTALQKQGQAEATVQDLEEYSVLSFSGEALPKERFSLYALQDTSTLVKTGDRAPDFSLRAIDGHVYQLKDLRGKIVLIYFFDLNGGMELRYMEDLWRRFKSQGIVVLAIARSCESDELRPYKEELQLTLPLGGDPHRQVYGKFARKGIPRLYLVGPDGEVVHQSVANHRSLSGLADRVEAAWRGSK